MADDDFREGEKMAIDWLEGRSEMSDDLGLLVSGMTQPLDATAKGFLVTVGNAARMAKREDLPTPARAPAPRAKGPAKAQPTPEAPPAPAFDVDEFRRRRREHELAARLDELARRNAARFDVHVQLGRRDE